MEFKEFIHVDNDVLLYPLTILQDHVNDFIHYFNDIDFTSSDDFYTSIEGYLHQIYAISVSTSFLAKSLGEVFKVKVEEWHSQNLKNFSVHKT